MIRGFFMDKGGERSGRLGDPLSRIKIRGQVWGVQPATGPNSQEELIYQV